MNPGLVTLRVLHIVSGVFWAGGVFLFTLIVEPRLRALGPTVQRPAMQAITPVMGSAFGMAGAITILTGVTMVFVLRDGDLSSAFDSRWGWAILVGFISTLIAAVIGFGFALRTMRRMHGIAAGIEGRAPNPDEMHLLQDLSTRLITLARTVMVFLLITLLAMASARYL